MLKKLSCLVILVVFASSLKPVFGYDMASRHKALKKFNVKNNAYRLLTTNSCPGCYLVNAELSKLDLTNANLSNANLIGATFRRSTLVGANLSGAKIAGADFSGAQWVDGSICLEGSIGQCFPENPK